MSWGVTWALHAPVVFPRAPGIETDLIRMRTGQQATEPEVVPARQAKTRAWALRCRRPKTRRWLHSAEEPRAAADQGAGAIVAGGRLTMFKSPRFV